MYLTVVAAVARSAPIGVSRACRVRSAALYKVLAITIASEVAGPPTTPAVTEVVTKALAPWP